MGTLFSPFNFTLCVCVVSALFHFCLCNHDHVLCRDSERQALIRFKHGLIDEANQLDSWATEDRDCCGWVGIAYDNSTRHVLRIHLPGHDGRCDAYSEEASKQSLKGDISASLLDLKQFEHLDLSCNDFGGIQVPKFIGSLQNLRYLNLSNSKFSGVILPQLANLSKLHVLSLGKFSNENYPPLESTRMANMKWLTNLAMLHHLDMSGVDLSKAFDWLQVINTLPNLVQLHLSACNLSTIHPYVHNLNLTSLSLFDISYNPIGSSMPKWIFTISSLVSLDLSGCKFHGPIPTSTSSFRNLTSLKLLRVNGNNFMNSSLVLEQLSSSNLILLDISDCGFSSSIFDSLHNLTSLLSLDLSGNQLTKRIPKSLGNLCNLREIDLSHNNFGKISLSYLLESFFECKSPSLESLSLSENYIAGIIPHSIVKFSFPRTLDLSKNQISGPIPFWIGQLSSLEVLDLSDNHLNNSLPHQIGQLSSLKRLDLSENKLNGSLPRSMGQLSNLIFLDFSCNLLMGVLVESHFVSLVHLTHLDIGSNNNLTLRLQVANWIFPFQVECLFLKSLVIGPQFPVWLQSQKNLKYLDISNTRISSPMPQSFWKAVPCLTYLNVSGNQIQGTLRLLGIPATLEVLDLSYNEFSGSLHHLLCSNVVKETQQLHFGNNNLSGVIPECWEKWPRLVVLNLDNNNLSGEIPRTLGSLLHLKLLNMRGNKILRRIPSALMNLNELEILQLERNKLVGDIPTWIGTKHTLLRILNLRFNNFDGKIPHELCYLVHIQIMDLAHNNLSGNIPRCFNNFSVLSGTESHSEFQFSFSFGPKLSMVGDSLVMKGREDTYNTILGLVMLLDLSSNNLVGHIPSELVFLWKLKSLNLSSNQLTGRIPKKIGDMKQLISFDISSNKLFGELPMSLSKLNFLSSFNVSYNSLTGRIPTSTQIQSLNESSFFGNKLCGAPLTESDVCVAIEVPTHTIGDKKEDKERDWGLVISIIIGFVTGFWLIVTPLLISKSWGISYFHFFSKLIKV